MLYLLTQYQIDEIWKTLNLEKKDWINEYVKQRKRDKWFNVLAVKKGIVLDETMTNEEKRKMIDDWELIEVLDGGKGNRPYSCECGKSLRYQYTVYHSTLNKTYRLGSTCMEHYTGLPAEIIRDVNSGFLQINTKLNELLVKIESQQFTDLTKYVSIGIEIPEDITLQTERNIPLFDEQIDLLDNLFHDMKWKRELEERKVKTEEWKELIRNKSSRNNKISYPEQFDEARKTKSTYTYDSFIDEHLTILKQIREKEELLSPVLFQEWQWMQNEVRRLKREETMDFDKFRLRMNNIMIPLKIQG